MWMGKLICRPGRRHRFQSRFAAKGGPPADTTLALPPSAATMSKDAPGAVDIESLIQRTLASPSVHMLDADVTPQRVCIPLHSLSPMGPLGGGSAGEGGRLKSPARVRLTAMEVANPCCAGCLSKVPAAWIRTRLPLGPLDHSSLVPCSV